ncbi:MAG: DUF1566 domain-containing protein [Magnetococcus sp. YQC-5]
MSPLLAGPQPAPVAPTDPGSAMYTLEDLYNRLNSGTDGVKRTGPFTEPAGTPGATTHNLNDIMSKAPLPDNAHGATAADVLCGGSFWSLRTDGTWGQQIGTANPCPPTNIQVLSDNKTISWSPSIGATSYNLYLATQSGLTKNNYTSLPNGARIQNISNPYTFPNTVPYSGTIIYIYIEAVIVGGNESFLSDPVTTILPRFGSNNNGTVTDFHTGLILLQNSGCLGSMDWDSAMAAAAKLGNGQCGLTDGSTPGQWRLPTQPSGELGILVATKNSTAFTNVQSCKYWSSTDTIASQLTYAWVVSLINGNSGTNYKAYPNCVWPVRGGK